MTASTAYSRDLGDELRGLRETCMGPRQRGRPQDSNCVEVSLSCNALVRDSKNASGDVLAFSAPAWRNLLRSLGSR